MAGRGAAAGLAGVLLSDDRGLGKTLVEMHRSAGIAGSGDKAIVFIEDLAVQRAFAEFMAMDFDLEEIPGTINGGLAGDRRQAIVDRFQEASPGFDLLVCRLEPLVLASRSLPRHTCSISVDGGTQP